MPLQRFPLRLFRQHVHVVYLAVRRAEKQAAGGRHSRQTEEYLRAGVVFEKFESGGEGHETYLGYGFGSISTLPSSFT